MIFMPLSEKINIARVFDNDNLFITLLNTTLPNLILQQKPWRFSYMFSQRFFQ